MIFPGVKTKFFTRILAAIGVGLVLVGPGALALAEEAEAPTVVPLGNNTYSVTRHAKEIFTRDTHKYKAQAMEDAYKYCASQGKQLKLVSVTEDKPSFIRGGFAKATVTFMALEASDPALVSAPASAPVPIASTGKQEPNEDFYNDLGKLEDLHNRGILLDAEFAAAKKRMLDRLK
jgi:hypothetical protein